MSEIPKFKESEDLEEQFAEMLQGDPSSLPDQALLEVYQWAQVSQKSKINVREAFLREGNTALAEHEQDVIEDTFIRLDVFKKEIEKRKLQRPTMDERGL